MEVSLGCFHLLTMSLELLLKNWQSMTQSSTESDCGTEMLAEMLAELMGVHASNCLQTSQERMLLPHAVWDLISKPNESQHLAYEDQASMAISC